MDGGTSAGAPLMLSVRAGRLILELFSLDHYRSTGKTAIANCGVPLPRLLAVDAAGRICSHPSHYERAARDDTFPVSVYDTALPDHEPILQLAPLNP